jgi:hypothetical protein
MLASALRTEMNVAAIPTESADPFAAGFYTVHEAARLLGMSNAGVITAWLKGRGAKGAPVIHRQYSPIGKHQELGFLDLIEVRFIEHFRKHGYSLQRGIIRLTNPMARASVSSQRKPCHVDPHQAALSR